MLIKFPANSPRATGVEPKLSWYVMDSFLRALDITDTIHMLSLVVAVMEDTGSNGKYLQSIKERHGPKMETDVLVTTGPRVTCSKDFNFKSC